MNGQPPEGGTCTKSDGGKPLKAGGKHAFIVKWQSAHFVWGNEVLICYHSSSLLQKRYSAIGSNVAGVPTIVKVIPE
jgi:hypothetical protein